MDLLEPHTLLGFYLTLHIFMKITIFYLISKELKRKNMVCVGWYGGGACVAVAGGRRRGTNSKGLSYEKY